MSCELTPAEIVAELDKYIVGQDKAKRSVAIALRNRYRRSLLHEELRDEVVPKNILMIGPTGVGKTEIARRLAKLVNAPFVKIEATKFTEVGYVGRDVDSMVRDLVEVSIRMVKQEKTKEVENKAAKQADEALLEILVPNGYTNSNKNPFDMLFGNNTLTSEQKAEIESKLFEQRSMTREKLLSGKIDHEYVEIEVDDSPNPAMDMFVGSNFEELGMNFQNLFGNIFPKKKKKKKVAVQQARKMLTQAEAQRIIDMEEVINHAVRRAEQNGIIFLDEIDKNSWQR